MISRRNLLRNFGYLTATIALSKVADKLGGINVHATSPAPMAVEQPSLHALAKELGADRGVWLGETRLLNTPSAFKVIYDKLGLNWNFSSHIDYTEACQCYDEFSKHEKVWRPYSNMFTDVQRSDLDPDVAYLVGGKYNPTAQGWSSIQGATQFQCETAIRMDYDDPSIVLAAATLLEAEYDPCEKEVAQSLTLLSKQPVQVWVNGVLEKGVKYTTPNVDFYHYPSPHTNPNTGRVYNKGRLAFRNNNSADNTLKFKGLYF